MVIKESKYGMIAVQAAGGGQGPVQAWEEAAIAMYPGKPASQRKGCPKSVFLGLAAAGEIVSVAPGTYTRSEDNARYAREAMKLIRQNATNAQTPTGLWLKIMSKEEIFKVHNGQMDVITALWREGLLAT